MAANPSPFSTLRAALQRHVERNLVAGVSHALVRGQEVVERHCAGHARLEEGELLREDHLFRAFSNTKLFTSMAVLQLHEAGHFALDEPIDRFIPELSARQVLKPGATSLADTEPAKGPITVTHLLTHTSGLSYGIFDPGTPMFKAYVAAQVLHPGQDLAQMMQRLAGLPLSFHPGSAWQYSVATDVLGRLVEIASGLRLDTYLERHIFKPLGLQDTGFVVPADQQHRLAGYYQGADLMQPMLGGLTRVDATQPYPGAYVRPAARLSGGGGLVSSLPDMLRVVQSLLPGGPALLRPETLALAMRDHLPAEMSQQFPLMGAMPSRGHGLAGGVVRSAGPSDHPGATGEFYWGGVAGTQWWVNPRLNIGGVMMTQRVMGFMHPIGIDYKREAYAALMAGS